MFSPASQGSVQLWSSVPLELWEELCQPYWSLSSSRQFDTLAPRLARSNSLCSVLCHQGKVCCLWGYIQVNTLSFKEMGWEREIAFIRITSVWEIIWQSNPYVEQQTAKCQLNHHIPSSTSYTGWGRWWWAGSSVHLVHRILVGVAERHKDPTGMLCFPLLVEQQLAAAFY